jgi:heme-degrading monooxygenase HmoA
MTLAATPTPPYTAVIFSSIRTSVEGGGDQGYGVMAGRMEELAAQQPGYLGIEWARAAEEGGTNITVSYWADDDAARAWKKVAEHTVAQERGKTTWYADYRVRVCTVERDYGHPSPAH